MWIVRCLLALVCLGAFVARASIVTNTIVETSADEGCYHYRSTLEQFKGLDIVVDRMTSGWRVGAHHDGGKGYVAGDTGFPAVCYLCFRDQRKFVEFTGTRDFYARFNWVEAYTDDEMAYYNGWLHFRVTIDGKLRLVESQMETVPGYRVPLPKEAVGSGDGTQSGDSSGGGTQEENPSGGGSGSPLLPDPQNRSSYYHDEYEQEWTDDEGFEWVDAVIVYGETHESYYKGGLADDWIRHDAEEHHMRIETCPAWDVYGVSVRSGESNATEKVEYWNRTVRRELNRNWDVEFYEDGVCVEKVLGVRRARWDEAGKLLSDYTSVETVGEGVWSYLFTNVVRTVTRDSLGRVVRDETVTERHFEGEDGAWSESESNTEMFSYWKDSLLQRDHATVTVDRDGLESWRYIDVYYRDDGSVDGFCIRSQFPGATIGVGPSREPSYVKAISEADALRSVDRSCDYYSPDREPPPEGLTPEMFADYFRARAVPANDGEWAVYYDVDPEAIGLEDTTKELASALGAIASGAVESVTLPAKPGLWYGLAYKSSLDAPWEMDGSVMARSETVTLPVPKPGTSLFMVVAVGMKSLLAYDLNVK